jgi:hypothetical protein
MLFIFEYCNKQFYKLLNIVPKAIGDGSIGQLKKIIFLVRQGGGQWLAQKT